MVYKATYKGIKINIKIAFKGIGEGNASIREHTRYFLKLNFLLWEKYKSLVMRTE